MVAETLPDAGRPGPAACCPTWSPSSASGWRSGLPGRGCWPRLIKRRTRGLEPAEITALADQREAVLHSIRGGRRRGRAGRVGHRDERQRPRAARAGRRRRRPPASTTSASTRGCATALAATPRRPRRRAGGLGDRVLVLNRNRVSHGGRDVGTRVTTLRDRTELLAMQSELSARESITETLRAQTHEFNNQLHTISGLIQLEEYDELSRWIGAVTRRRAEITDAVTPTSTTRRWPRCSSRRTSLAAERGVGLRARRRQRRCRASTRTWPPTSAPCSATSSTTRSTRPCRPAARR